MPSHSLPNSLFCLLLAALPGCGGCSKDPSPRTPIPAQAPAPTDRLLVVDGIVITFADVQPFVDYLDTIYADHSRRTKIRRILDEYVLPMRLAQRAFPEQRREQLERANALRGVADNAVELQAKAALFHPARKNWGRRDVELPVSQFLFDTTRTGAVSEPIEVPHGYKLVAALDLAEAAVVGDDLVDGVIVPFVTHDVPAMARWYDEQKSKLSASWIHPDYRDAAPEWLKLP